MASLSDPLVQELLSRRYVASLATENRDGSIHIVAVWYWFDGAAVYVGTSSRSRKARNLHSNAKASLMIDSRDPAASRGISIAGATQLLTGEVSREWNAKIHRKYLSDAAVADTRVGPVFEAMEDITIRITPMSVITWDLRELDRQALGGALQNNPGYLLPPER